MKSCDPFLERPSAVLSALGQRLGWGYGRGPVSQAMLMCRRRRCGRSPVLLSQHYLMLPVGVAFRVAFHPAQSQVPTPLLWYVSNVLYLIDTNHLEMSYTEFLWEPVYTLFAIMLWESKCISWKMILAGNNMKENISVSCVGTWLCSLNSLLYKYLQTR
jgi:hypothetical protein